MAFVTFLYSKTTTKNPKNCQENENHLKNLNKQLENILRDNFTLIAIKIVMEMVIFNVMVMKKGREYPTGLKVIF